VIQIGTRQRQELKEALQASLTSRAKVADPPVEVLREPSRGARPSRPLGYGVRMEAALDNWPFRSPGRGRVRN